MLKRRSFIWEPFGKIDHQLFDDRVARSLRYYSKAWLARARLLEGLMDERFVPAIKLADVPENGMVSVTAKGARIAVANVQGVYYAFDDECTHEQCSLAEGDLAGTTVTCMCHGAEFDVRSGAVLAPPAVVPIKVYRTRVDGDSLYIEV
jgi:nitrite reductase/ring-hydroxylating ferredoxin subunit